MSWRAVARKDFQDATRSYVVMGLSALFVALITLIIFLLSFLTRGATSSQVLNTVHILFSYLIPLIAFVMAHGAIVGERESGSIKLLLALPHDRAEVVLGKVIGRSTALVVPLTIGLLLPAIGMLLGGAQVQWSTYIGYLLLTALVGIAFVSIAVGFSSALESRFQVLIGAFSFYFVFVVLWRLLNQASFMILLYLIGSWPDWMPVGPGEAFQTARLVSPTGDYFILKKALFSGLLFAPQIPQGARVADASTQAIALLMLGVWIVLPMAVGIYVFEKVDL